MALMIAKRISSQGVAIVHKLGRRNRWSSNGEKMGNIVKIKIGCPCGLRYTVFAKMVCGVSMCKNSWNAWHAPSRISTPKFL